MLEYLGILSVPKCRMDRSLVTSEEEEDKALTVVDQKKKAGGDTMGMKNLNRLLRENPRARAKGTFCLLDCEPERVTGLSLKPPKDWSGLADRTGLDKVKGEKVGLG